MKKKLSILIFTSDYKPNPGGIAEYIHSLASNLETYVKDIDVISYNLNGSAEFDKKSDLNTIRWPTLNKNKIARFFQKTICNPIRFIKILQKGNYDFVLFNSLVSPILISIAILWKKVKGYKWGILLYGLDIFKIRPPFSKKIINIELNKTDVIFTISTYTKNKLLNTHNIAPKKVKIIRPAISSKFNVGTDTINEIRGESMKNKMFILSVGRLIERKGVDRLIEAMKIVCERIPEVQLFIAGKGPYEKKLHEIAKDIGLYKKNIKFFGYVSEEEKHTLYRYAKLFVMPNRELSNGDVEGFGIVFLEANIYGLPVIGGNSGGATDAIVSGKTGFLIDPNNTEELAEKIIYLLENKQIAKKMGIIGKKRAKTLTWKKAGEKMFFEINNLISK